MTSRNKPAVAFWATVVVVVVLVAYPLSFGPVLLLEKIAGINPWWAYEVNSRIYAPLTWTLEIGPEWYGNAFYDYHHWWVSLVE